MFPNKKGFLLQTICILLGYFEIIKCKVHQEILRGSYKTSGKAQLVSPPVHPEESSRNYKRDGDVYIFIIENTELGGAIQLVFTEFFLHPDSWVLVRDGKYGGYIGKVVGRYDDNNLPPAIILSDSCCLRLEFNIGCCGPAYPGSTGLVATYKYVYTPNKGRRADCSSEPVYTQYCNGECIPPLNNSCPASIPEPHSIKSKYGRLYPLAIIIAVICAFLLISLLVLIIITCVERLKKAKEKEVTSDHDSVLLGAMSNKLQKEDSMASLLRVNAAEAKECQNYIDTLNHSRSSVQYSTESLPSEKYLYENL